MITCTRAIKADLFSQCQFLVQYQMPTTHKISVFQFDKRFFQTSSISLNRYRRYIHVNSSDSILFRKNFFNFERGFKTHSFLLLPFYLFDTTDNCWKGRNTERHLSVVIISSHNDSPGGSAERIHCSTHLAPNVRSPSLTSTHPTQKW